MRYNSYANQRPPFDAKNPFLAKVAVNGELHNGGGEELQRALGSANHGESANIKLQGGSPDEPKK